MYCPRCNSTNITIKTTKPKPERVSMDDLPKQDDSAYRLKQHSWTDAFSKRDSHTATCKDCGHMVMWSDPVDPRIFQRPPSFSRESLRT